ncbi:hypothetical protein MVEN_00005400 [Mycena venus]|uniref:Uncharacterized protein n=1 Tax=Mycena venus TaxID=2733690 RepID=A0A8H6Z704_9AGAR|nr:hypothetical protein MVEN_00005400 [Mycena venus]
MSRPRLAALFDTPSSPLAPPPGSSGDMGSTTPTGTPSRHNSSLPGTPTIRHRHGFSSSPYASAGRNRWSRHSGVQSLEDFTQAGVLIGRKLKLKPEGVMMLDDFAKNATSINEVKSYAQLLKITEMQAAVATTAANFVIPKKLEHKIDMHSFRTLMSPTLGFYVKKAGPDSPSGIMRTLIIDHGSQWGVTSDVIDDKAQWGVIVSRVRNKLTDRRYDIKKVLCDAVWILVKTEEGETVLTNREDPLDIIQLCEALVNIVPDAGVKVTLPMMGRVAILRQVLIDESGGPKFWERVDEQLSKIREKYENDESRISRAIAKVLKNDCRTYGSPDISLFQ